MKRSTWAALAACLASSCSASTTVTPTKNLDRPIDMTFVCLGTVEQEGGLLLTGKPMQVCHPPGEVDPAPTTGARRTLGTFAFIPNPGRDELAVADIDSGRLLDLQHETPGYGLLPVGNDPEAVASSDDGCWVMTANRTSCDFSMVDTSRLLAGTFSSAGSTASPATGEGDVLRRMRVRTGSGRRLATGTGEIAFLPATSAGLCQTTAAGVHPRAVATFPGCDLVAVMDLSFETGEATITSAYYVRPDVPGGYVSAGADPVCPVDCAIRDDEDVDPVATAVDAGDPLDGGIGIPSDPLDGGVGPVGHVQPLALVPGGARLYVGGLFDESLTSFDLAGGVLTTPRRIALSENPVGVSRIRLGIDPSAIRSAAWTDRGSFLYAFARDGSVRVVDVGTGEPKECDVNIIAPPEQKGVGCLPVGTQPRRASADGPGIRIPNTQDVSNPAPLARDIAFVDLQPAPGNDNLHALSGQFGFLLASNGYVYVLNVAPAGEGTVTATHSFREIRDSGEAARDPLVMSIAPQRSVVSSDQAFATTVNFAALDGPLIQSYSTDNGLSSVWVDFPDPDTIVSWDWSVVWEGALPRATRVSGLPRAVTGGAGVLVDPGADFCGSTVQSGDIVQFAGCTRDSDCQPDDQFSCQITVSGARGMCLPRHEGASSPLIDQCRRFMGSRMRYEVVSAKPTELTLGLLLDEVPKTTLNPCTVDADCHPDPQHRSIGSVGDEGFKCLAVQADGARRCVKPCQASNLDKDCRPGHVCQRVGNAGELCVQAPPIDPACFPQPMTSYSVRAGKSYVVYGSLLPTLYPTKVAADGTCQVDSGGNVARIPLSAPVCPAGFLSKAHPARQDPASGQIVPPVFVQNLPAEPGANPCLYNDGLDGSPTTVAGQRVRAFYENPQIRFVLANLDQYAGDLVAIHFRLDEGYRPLTVNTTYEVSVTMGTRILTGPTKTPESPLRQNAAYRTSYPYLYVVDQGRTALTPGSRGQVVRINPRSGTSEVPIFDSALSGSTPFLIQ